MNQNTLPAIPEVKDQVFKDAVASLCRVAGIFHRCFTATLEGTPPMDLAAEHSQLLLDCEQVLQAWQDHLGHTVEDLLEDG